MTSSARSRQAAASSLARRALEAFAFLVEPHGKLGVAVSGGSDSLALLALAADYCRAHNIACFAITIDHGLRPEAADEARFVGKMCDQLGVTHTTLTWTRASAATTVSQEEAREARHGLMAAWARDAGVRQLALGHTRDDRLETFLMRARQGSGWHGLASLMPNACSPAWPAGRDLRLVRPLLPFGREELRDELRARKMSWVEDPSNKSARYERVRMRRLLMRMDQGTRDAALHAMDRLIEMRAAIAREASHLLERVTASEDGLAASLPLEAADSGSREAGRRVVEAVVAAAGGAARLPRREALDRLLKLIADNDEMLQRGVTLAGARIRARNGLLTFSQAPARRGTTPGPPPDWQRARMLLTPPDLRVFAV